MMITEIKYALAFLAGAVYASSWWLVLSDIDMTIWMILPRFVVSLVSFFMFLLIVFSLYTHWNDDKEI